MTHLEVTPNLNVVSTHAKARKGLGAETVLEELFVLLEDYGPVWYTKRHRDRVLRALRETAMNESASKGGRGKNLARAS